MKVIDASKTSPDLPHEVVHFGNLKRTLGYALPPRGESSDLAKAVKGILLAVGKVDEAAARARKIKLDRREFVQMVDPLRSAATDATAAAAKLAEAQRVAAQRKRAGLLAPPPLHMSDAVAAAYDVHIISELQGMPQQARDRILNGVAAGEQHRVRDALLRSPFETPATSIAKAAWAAARRAQARADFDDCDKMDAEAAWAIGVAGSAGNVIRESIADIAMTLDKSAA